VEKSNNTVITTKHGSSQPGGLGVLGLFRIARLHPQELIMSLRTYFYIKTMCCAGVGPPNCKRLPCGGVSLINYLYHIRVVKYTLYDVPCNMLSPSVTKASRAHLNWFPCAFSDLLCYPAFWMLASIWPGPMAM